jgi:hypothetical protein
VALDVEPGDVTTDEVDARAPVSQLEGAAVAPGGDDGDIEGARNRTVGAGGADAHQGAVGDMAAGPGDGQGRCFQRRPPVSAHAVVGHGGEQARRESMQRSRPLQSREL